MARGGPAQALGVTAAQDRWTLENSGPGIGVIGYDDMLVTAGSGLLSSIAAGRCRIRAVNSAGLSSGVYELTSDAPITRGHASANGAYPRLDQIIARVVDFQEQGQATSEDIVILPGLATSGASLDNRNGAAIPPVNSILLADVLVPAGASSAAGFSYRDRRPFASNGAVPRIRTSPGQVPSIGMQTELRVTSMQTGTIFGWMLRYLPRRITASKIRWAYRQGSPVFVGNYNIGIYDASGRLVVSSGPVAAVGSANTLQNRSETITTTTFEPGAYYVAFGFVGSSGGATYLAEMQTGVTGGPATIYPVPATSMCGGISGAGPPGGTTFPTILQGTIDNITTSLTIGEVRVPVFTLSAT